MLTHSSQESIRIHSKNEQIELWPLWNRRQSTKFNGVSYIVQKGAEAIYSPEGKKEVRNLIDFYMQNAKIMKNKLQTAGYKVFGGDNAPISGSKFLIK